jgi:hypothetical protein
MNTAPTPRPMTVSLELQRAEQSRLHGRWLILARVVCFTLIVLALLFFFATLPVYSTQLQTICQTATCATGQLTPQTVGILQNLGLSVTGYVILNVVLTIAFAFVWFAVAGVLLWRKSDDAMALLVATMLVMLGIYGGQGGNGHITVAESHSIWQFPALLLTGLAYFALFLVFSFFPTGRFVPRWIRWVVIVWLLETVSHDLLSDWPFTLSPWIYPLNFLIFIVGILILLGSQIYRYLRISSLVQRQQTKWILFGITVYIVGSLVAYLPVLIFPSLHLNEPSSLYSLVLLLLNTFMLLLIPLTFGISMLRYRLWDIDLIINRTLVYGTLTVILGLVYTSLVIGLQSLLRGIINQNSDVAIVVSTLAIAALFQPFRSRIQAIIDRRFYRRKYDATRTLAAFSATLRNEVDLEQLREQLVAVVQETMQPAHVSLWLRPTQQNANHKPWRANPLTSSHTDE